jgi:hypothetical protein
MVESHEKVYKNICHLTTLSAIIILHCYTFGSRQVRDTKINIPRLKMPGARIISLPYHPTNFLVPRVPRADKVYKSRFVLLP